MSQAETADPSHTAADSSSRRAYETLSPAALLELALRKDAKIRALQMQLGKLQQGYEYTRAQLARFTRDPTLPRTASVEPRAQRGGAGAGAHGLEGTSTSPTPAATPPSQNPSSPSFQYLKDAPGAVGDPRRSRKRPAAEDPMDGREPRYSPPASEDRVGSGGSGESGSLALLRQPEPEPEPGSVHVPNGKRHGPADPNGGGGVPPAVPDFRLGLDMEHGDDIDSLSFQLQEEYGVELRPDGAGMDMDDDIF